MSRRPNTIKHRQNTWFFITTRSDMCVSSALDEPHSSSLAGAWTDHVPGQDRRERYAGRIREPSLCEQEGAPRLLRGLETGRTWETRSSTAETFSLRFLGMETFLFFQILLMWGGGLLEADGSDSHMLGLRPTRVFFFGVRPTRVPGRSQVALKHE